MTTHQAIALYETVFKHARESGALEGEITPDKLQVLLDLGYAAGAGGLYPTSVPGAVRAYSFPTSP